MVRTLALRTGAGAALLGAAALAAAAFIGLPGASAQQGFPPDTPMVLHGSATGAVEGQGVHAVVNNGGTWTYCGSGAVVPNNGGVRYVVQVASQSQTTGCGASGRTIKLYFSPAVYGVGGSLSNESLSWVGTSGVATEENVTLGAAYQIRGVVPALAAQVE